MLFTVRFSTSSPFGSSRRGIGRIGMMGVAASCGNLLGMTAAWSLTGHDGDLNQVGSVPVELLDRVPCSGLGCLDIVSLVIGLQL
ncbi:hypothetical protein F3Y22_tig00013808pilonHSYRG00111 [Hibiscus syriacus]|uniref:Uncharacterized protein n=1 Tax=Hibiscus syriacus TaxID=106335 RepID=A0A6A3C6I7_HIBSY|nr:hypothetical protein F3Y22_tig00013808pilonHSYRG00111 [Hibiscus syriacus]